MNVLPSRISIQQRLAEVMDAGEARAVSLLLFEKLFGMTVADVLSGKDETLKDDEKRMLLMCVERIAKGEPVQYVMGRCDFNGLELKVAPGVLIPRPETEELVKSCVGHYDRESKVKVLDIGTGSGCIALSIKHRLHNADVTGWDVSDDALSIAVGNAERLALNVAFQHHDILDIDNEIKDITPEFDIIISNPPYVCECEKKDMERRVLDFEPKMALFVPDSDPLRFYRHITAFAIKALKQGGRLFFETNRAYSDDVAKLLSENGFVNVKKLTDSFGNDRIVHGTLYRY